MVNVAVIGCGHWGPNLIRNFAKVSNARLHTLCDLRVERLETLRSLYNPLKITEDYHPILEDPEIEAVVIASPASSHYQVAKESLLAGKHVFVEKPLALRVSECEELIATAEAKRRVLMVGHVFRYNAAVWKLKEYIQGGELGEIHYIYSTRLNLGRVRNDLNAMWNFAPHDLSILLYLLEEEPLQVSARGFSYLQNEIEDVVFMILNFPGNIGAHIHISWLDPSKVRRMTIVGNRKMAIYDDVSIEAKIRIYDKGIKKVNNHSSLALSDYGGFQLQVRSGDIYIPKIDFVEPLYTECSHFIECIKEGKKPLTDGYEGLRVVRILEAARLSMEEEGMPVSL
jgi:predicted dehydrogenase